MSDKFRAVLIGCGSMSGEWLRSLRNHHSDSVEIVGLVDLRVEAAVAKAKEFDLSVWTGRSLDEALAATKPDIVFNCTIPEAHVATCATALQAGCHVLMEKPLSPSVQEGRELARLAREKGRLLAVIQNRRYLAGGIAIRQYLADDLIGAVHTLNVDFYLGPHFGGFRETMEHVLLLDMAIHTFDQCRHMLGRNATRVMCHEFNPRGSWFAHGASAMALFEMEGGGCFSYRGSWCARGLSTSWEGSWRIIGEKGTLLWDGGDLIVVERLKEPWDGKGFYEPVERLEIPVPKPSPAELGHAGNIGEFVRAISMGGVPQTHAEDNLQSLAMIEAAIESARLGRPVDISVSV